LKNEWDEYADGWDSNDDVVRYSEHAYQSLAELVKIEKTNILDFGAGTGCLTEKLAQKAERVVALDTSLAMLSVLEKKSLPNVLTIGEELSRELIVSHAFLQSRFDVIVASSVCGFLPDYEGTLRLLKSLLAPGGWFVQWDWLASDGESGHGLTEEAVRKTLVGVGLEDVAVSQPFTMVGKESEMVVLMGAGRKV
jgi:2-polyprenyl-3-methyl-5-hydroxy-6-metoxy-1,4-benzoquinol methylase